jgi:hypothetical protein
LEGLSETLHEYFNILANDPTFISPLIELGKNKYIQLQCYRNRPILEIRKWEDGMPTEKCIALNQAEFASLEATYDEINELFISMQDLKDNDPPPTHFMQPMGAGASTKSARKVGRNMNTN